jgi:hypothetical protein
VPGPVAIPVIRNPAGVRTSMSVRINCSSADGGM